MLKCIEVAQFCSLQRDGVRVGLATRLSVRVHLLLCAACQQYCLQVVDLQRIARCYANGAAPAPSDRHSGCCPPGQGSARAQRSNSYPDRGLKTSDR